jgi:hypothetical protein
MIRIFWWRLDRVLILGNRIDDLESVGERADVHAVPA